MFSKYLCLWDDNLCCFYMLYDRVIIVRKDMGVAGMIKLTTTKQLCITGVKEIDAELGGGIIAGSFVCIEGQPGTGKSILSQYLAHGGLHYAGSTVAYYTTESSARGLIGQMLSLSLNVTEGIMEDKFRIYPINVRIIENPEKSLYLLSSHLSKISEEFNLVILDSVTAFTARSGPVAIFDFFSTCREQSKRGNTIILVLDSHALDDKILSRALTICDYHLRLSVEDMRLKEELSDNKLIKLLEARKLHGAEQYAREGTRFEIDPLAGIQVIPFAKLKM